MWQQELAQAVTSVTELCQLLELDVEQIKLPVGVGGNFKLKVPRAFVARMQVGDYQDPLLLQVLPGYQEDLVQDGYTNDPLAEASFNPCSGLLHKYYGRVLLVLTGACAINCRYCFRRHFPYSDNNSKNNWVAIRKYILADPSITELILSGGDPLLLSDKYLARIVDELGQLTQITRLRIHSRIPVVLPSRISDDLLGVFQAFKRKIVLVIHTNHPRELNAEVAVVLNKLRLIGITIFNQAVLLKGINDHQDTLVELSEVLFNAGVIPYYLHVLDKVQGAAHFAVARRRAKQLHAMVSNTLPGYLVPRLVHEVAGAKAKVAL